MTELCNAKHTYQNSKTPSGRTCTLPAGHVPAEKHADVSEGRPSRRWTERVIVFPNRAERRANARKMRREFFKAYGVSERKARRDA